MNRVKKLLKNTDYTLLILPIFFAFISITFIISTTYSKGFIFSKDIVVQASSYALGFVSIFCILIDNYNISMQFPSLLYVMCIIILILPFTPLGIEQYGSRAWINLGIVTFQPSEAVKVLFPLCFSGFLARRADRLNTIEHFIPVILYATPVILLILKEDMGNALVLSFMTVIMIYFSGIHLELFLKAGLTIVVSLPFAWYFLEDYQKQRISAFLHPRDLSLAGNYQVWNSKVAVGSGGFFGKGLFHGTQKELKYLPVQKSDFIFSVLVEELGFAGGFFLLILYGLFFFRVFQILMSTTSSEDRIIVSGFAAMFAFQIFENIGMTMGLMPVTGITLPFISCGGSSVLMSMVALGIILKIGKKCKT